MEWYEKLKNQCRVCKKYLAEILVKQTRDNFYWKCRFCGAKRKHERSWGIWEHKKGHSFLKTKEHNFKEMKLTMVNSLPQITEVEESLL